MIDLGGRLLQPSSPFARASRAAFSERLLLVDLGDALLGNHAREGLILLGPNLNTMRNYAVNTRRPAAEPDRRSTQSTLIQLGSTWRWSRGLPPAQLRSVVPSMTSTMTDALQPAHLQRNHFLSEAFRPSEESAKFSRVRKI